MTIVSTFSTRRISVVTGTTISLSRSMPWMSVPKRCSTPITVNGTDSISSSWPIGSLPGNSVAAADSPMRATRAAVRTCSSSKKRPRIAGRSQTRGERADWPSTRTVAARAPAFTAAAGRACCGSQAVMPGTASATAAMSSMVSRAASGRGPPSRLVPRAPTRMASPPKICRMVALILRCTPWFSDSTSVTSAMPTSVPKATNVLRTL